MNEIDLEYTAIERPLPPMIPIRDIYALVIAVDLTTATDDIRRPVAAVAAWLAKLVRVGNVMMCWRAAAVVQP